MDRRQALVRNETLPERTSGTVVVADISGFTPLTEALAQSLGPQRGAEALTFQLNQLFGALIAEVHRYGGSVICFSGDAITCWFDGDSGLRGTACALAMQQALRQLAGVVPLAITMAVVAGRVRRFLVGAPEIQRIDVLAGRTLDALTLIAQQAEPGDVVIDALIARRLAACAVVSDWRAADPAGRPVAVVTGLVEPVAPAPWPALPLAGPSEDHARTWLLSPVYERLRRNPGQFLAELRPAVALFLSFSGIDYDADDDAGVLLDDYIRRVQALVARYAGSLLQVTIGDKGSYLYIAFGAPIAHDDDAARAIAAALDLRSPPPNMGFIRDIRIGIACGQMYTGAYGSPERQTYGVLGDKANLAARLMTHAGAGEILCDDEVYRRAQHRWLFEALPSIRVKGKAALIRVYRPTGQPASSNRQPAQAGDQHRLVGRAAEVARLEGILDALTAGEQRILFIEGEAGIGKSRLVAELARLMRERGQTGLRGAGQSIEQQTPYRAWHDIFSSYFDLDEIADPAERRTRVRSLVEELVPKQMQRLPLLNDLLNLDFPETPLTAALDPALRQESLVMFLIALLDAWARERPLILVLEDAHWLDSLSWSLAVQLARVLFAAPGALLLVLVHRPFDEQDAAAQQSAALRAITGAACETLALTALSQDQTVALVTERLGLPEGDLPAAVAALVRQRAGGNPFFAEELVLTLRDQGLITIVIEPGAPTVPPVARCIVGDGIDAAGQTLPDTLQGLILARIDRLPPEKQLVLKVAAVIGRAFAYTPLFYTLNHYTTMVEHILKAHLADLTRHDLIVLESMEPDLSYIFKHVIMQEVPYQTLLFAQRKQLHRIVASWYETTFSSGTGLGSQPHAGPLGRYYPLLVHHYRYAEDAERERGYARLAGEQAAAQYANAEAVFYFSRALELTPEADVAARYDLLLAREKVYDLQGNRERQRQDLDALEALALADDRRRAEVVLRRAAYTDAIGDYTAAQVAAQQSVALAQATGAVELQAAGQRWWGVALWRQGAAAARTQLERALAFAQAYGLRDAEARSLGMLGNVAWSQGDYAAARASYEQALPLYPEIGDRRGESTMLNNIGIAADAMSDYAGARASYEQALHLSREIGFRRGESFALSSLGSLADALGDYAAARTSYEQCLQLYRAIGDRPGESEVLQYLGLLWHHLGDDMAARNYSEQALLIAQEVGARDQQARALIPLGGALLGLRRPAAAAAAYQQALRLRRELGQHNLAMEALAGLARVALVGDELAQAGAHVAEILGYLATNTLDGTDEPFRVHMTCYEVLHASHDPRAEMLLRTIHALLRERAAKISDPELRRSFLENVAAHRAIIRAYAALVG
jgi:predicted ATPase/class 3 adenylate cyclase